MRKPVFCTSENKDTDKLLSNRAADQRLCFRYIYSTIPGLCWTWSKTSSTGFAMMRLNYKHASDSVMPEIPFLSVFMNMHVCRHVQDICNHGSRNIPFSLYFVC